MAIKLLATRQKNPATKAPATAVDLLIDEIDAGNRLIAAANGRVYYARATKTRIVSSVIRSCNRILGSSESFKNGCLYREEGLSLFWTKNDGAVVCDHAVPVTDLVRLYYDGVPLIYLALYPVARISATTELLLRGKGLATKGWRPGLPLSRYARVGARIVTHFGQCVDCNTWTDGDHWDLVRRTQELDHIVRHFKL